MLGILDLFRPFLSTPLLAQLSLQTGIGYTCAGPRSGPLFGRMAEKSFITSPCHGKVTVRRMRFSSCGTLVLVFERLCGSKCAPHVSWSPCSRWRARVSQLRQLVGFLRACPACKTKTGAAVCATFIIFRFEGRWHHASVMRCPSGPDSGDCQQDQKTVA